MREALSIEKSIKLFKVFPDGNKSEKEAVFVINELKEENSAGYIYGVTKDGITAGKLVEFYPDESFELSRDRYGTIKASKTEADEFDAACNSLSESVFTFNRFADNDAELGFFATSVYRKFSKNGEAKGTVYIFTAALDNCTEFNAALSAILSGDEHPQIKFSAIATLFVELGKAFLRLHKSGYSLGKIADDVLYVTPAGKVVFNPENDSFVSAIDNWHGNSDDMKAIAKLFCNTLKTFAGNTENCLPLEIFANNRF